MAKYTDNVWHEAPRRGDFPEERSVHRLAFEHCKSLEDEQRDIHYLNVLNAELYSNREAMAFSWDQEAEASYLPMNANLENVIQSVIDTLLARVGKQRPKATPITRGADFDVYLKGRQLDRYLEGEFVAQDIYSKGEMCILDSMVVGTGVLKIDVDGDELYTERVNPDEIIVDQRECVSCDYPTQLFHRKLVSRKWLVETYGKGDPDLRQRIMECQKDGFRYTGFRSPGEDQIVVIEAWKLPTRGKTGGRHSIVIQNATLLDESYNRDKFPFVFIKWDNPYPSGFYGRSLVESLTGYQIRLNELNEKIRIGQDLMCVPRVFVDQGSAITGAQFDTTIGRVIKFRGTLPVALDWSAFSAEIYNERDRLRQSAFEFAGVSQLSAQSKLPSQARLDSSEAFREYNAIEDERFNRQAQAIEKFYLDIAYHLLECSADLYRNKRVNRKNFWRSANLVEQIDWKSVDMDTDKYVLQIGASSLLNQSPAARIDKLKEWASSGAITMDQYKAYSGEPDLERMSDLLSAQNDLVEHHVDRMLHEEPMTPDPMMNLEYALRVVNDHYARLSFLDTPEDILQLFRDWIELAKELLEPTAMPMPGMPPAGPGAPAVDPATGMPMSPAGDASMGPAGAAMEPGPMVMGPDGVPINDITGAPAPSVSTPAANAFLGV
jgi:hypothetical protein